MTCRSSTRRTTTTTPATSTSSSPAISSGKLPRSALPAVSFLKAPGYQDGHAAYSDPADEQQFVVDEINALEQTPDWSSTAVIVNYDDSDGWYDHAYSGVSNPSLSPADNLTGTSSAGRRRSSAVRPADPGAAGRRAGTLRFRSAAAADGDLAVRGRDSVDHNLSDQSSIINLVEYNWGLPGIPGSADQALRHTDHSEGIPFDLAGLFRFHGEHGRHERRLFLDPSTGQPPRF